MSSTKKKSLHTGGRKTASALVKLTPSATTDIFVNNKKADLYFQKNKILLYYISQIYQLIDSPIKYKADIFVKGGGLSAQAQAVKLALAKAFLEYNPKLKFSLKLKKLLTRDMRIKERRKYGLRKARKAIQYSKR
uniref:ribosomal protein S9 n=1 Tax=Prototheca miyajii TaxID=2034260 RepID=UPI0030014726